MGAIGEKGEVLLSRLGGNGSSGSSTLYTLLELPGDFKAYVKLESRNTSSMWINGTEIISSEVPEGESIPVRLRKGRNSILIASGWKTRPEPVLFEICDESGLPVSILKNRLNDIITEYASLDATETESAPERVSSNSPREVILTLERGDCSSVSVIGSFNNWDPQATPMTEVENGKWRACIILSPGEYNYKFLVDRKFPIVDPASSLVEPDGFGGTNSVLKVK
jgi:hypothetical protein